ncbi:hypothetical protein THRCLA_07937 [Thraustotheca clavata]|uniref:Protein kinase domain-containing protein n=1 Tax=Thraustotheca clavata TaxID=74557 RepID=A0A1V9ZBR7_9STRA|nr:hypothetical protein THRCLA_07937 [Thraustotheca clavata]
MKTNALACSAIGGTTQSLWAATSPYKISVCVVNTTLTTSATEQPDKAVNPAGTNNSTTSNSTGTIVGVVVGVLGLIAIFSIVEQPYNPYIVPSPQKDGIDVAPLRQHKLELQELSIIDSELIASGGCGEVWLGSIAGEQVAIKRLKEKSESALQKFISEIILMSEMNSPYIVRFIGAYWTNPIEMQWVVEYMETDLRKFWLMCPPYHADHIRAAENLIFYNVPVLFSFFIPHFNMLWSFGIVIALVVKVVFASCPYGNLPQGTILVADANCYGLNAAVCGVDKSCKVVNSSMSDSDYDFTNLSGVGDLTYYTKNYLKISYTNLLNLKLMKLPSIVKTLEFRTIAQFDLTQIKTTLPDTLTDLYILNSSIGVIPLDFKWPTKITTIVLNTVKLQTIPRNLPSSLSELAIQGNYLKDLNYLPKNLTFLNFAVNDLVEILTMDWRMVNYIELSNNPLTTFANVELSNSLQYFCCDNCSLTNITVDTATYAALNALPPWDRDTNAKTYTGYSLNKRVTVNPANCKAIGGTVQSLWAGTSTYPISACVVGSVASTTTSPTSNPLTTSKAPSPENNTNSGNSEGNNTAAIVGIIVGVIGIIGITGALIIIKRRNRPEQPSDFGRDTNQAPYHYQPENDNPTGNSSFK